MPVPLDKMQVVSTSNKPQPSLHSSRIEKMVFVKYFPPPANTDDRAEYDAWLERVNYLCDDLHWLLQLPHDKFWCQVVFDAGLHKSLDSFIQFSPRSHETLMNLPAVGKQRQLELCRLVFMTYLRMSTHKESKDHFITPEVFGDILYVNFLFDIPKILDICSLFGKNNSVLLNKMIGNIFTQQPKYTNDLLETVPTILEVLSNIAAKCGIHLEGVGLSPKKLKQSLNAPVLSTMPTLELQDIMLYLSDTAITLHRFLDVYPPACSVFQQFHFCSVIANFYESVIPEITVALKQHEYPSVSLKKSLTSNLHHTKKSILAIFHSIVQHVCLQPVLENASNEEVVSAATEEFLHTMTSVLGERRFLAAYEGIFNFQDDVVIFLQASSTLDSSQFEYIQSAINSAFATFGRRKSPRGDTNTGGRTSPDGAPDSSIGGATAGKSGGVDSNKWIGAKIPISGNDRYLTDDFQTEDYGEGAISHPRPSDVEIESLITSIKDLFPHLGEGFLEIALEELDWNQEKTVSCILEEKLPPSLHSISTDLPRQQKEVKQEENDQTDNTDLVDSRRNVFDNDEFDMFRNTNVDMTKIHLGKKEKKVDLNDKSAVNAVRATYDVYGSIDKDNIYDYISGGHGLNQQLMYDDEYDDTYDSNVVGADDADSADELNNKKIVPRVIMDLERKKIKDERRGAEESDDDDEGENNDEEQRVKDQFLADPAKMRELAEQRRQSQAGGGRRYVAGSVPVNRDVKGGQKGQGQSKEVVHNRQVKKKYKGQRYQSNADKKMSKGMF
uniref:CUE domain-containing protein n=1 Tax=Arion vulgaris TaxID=1028688 RepID=A0A0B7AGQ0_9EUPU